MGRIFDITSPTEDIQADAAGKASAFFTVTNTRDKPVRGLAKAKRVGNTQQEWLEVEGEVERDFPARGTQLFKVNFSKPPVPAAVGATPPPAEKFPFRLYVFSSEHPEEEFTEGPTVRVEVTPGGTPVKKPFPWWIILVIAGVALLAGAIILFLVLQKGCAARPDLAGKWKMKTEPKNAFEFIGTLKIEQSQDGQLKGTVWKFRDEETGAPFMDFNGKISDDTGELEGTLKKENVNVKLKCKLVDSDHLSVQSSIQLPAPEGKSIEQTQILAKE